MNKEMKESLKLISKIISLIVFYLLCFWGLHFLFSKVSDENQANFWKELIMMILSAVFSATVAYIVSVLQIQRDIKRQKKNENNLDKKRVKLLVLEITDNIEVLEFLKKQQFPDKSQEILATQLSFEIYNRYIDKVDLSEEILRSLIKQNKKLNLYRTYSIDTMKDGHDKIIEVLKEIENELKKYNENSD